MIEFIQHSEAGNRYAKAYFELSLEAGEIEAGHQDMLKLKALLVQSRDLKRVLMSPVMASESKSKALKAVVADLSLSKTTLNLLGVLAKNGRLTDVLAVVSAFMTRYVAYKGIVTTEVTSAVALTSDQTAALFEALKKALGQTPEMITKVDASLLGGLKVKIGSRLYDGSLKTKLNSLKFALKRA